MIRLVDFRSFLGKPVVSLKFPQAYDIGCIQMLDLAFPIDYESIDAECRRVPDLVIQMVQIGEESGSLDAMLGKVADFFEEEVDEAVAALSSLMEPLIMVILGVLIGGLVVAMYLPIFKLGSVV